MILLRSQLVVTGCIAGTNLFVVLIIAYSYSVADSLVSLTR